MDAQSIINAVVSVTKPWAKQRKAEERGSRRPREYYYSDRVNFTDIADKILPTAYLHGSGNGQYTISQRQFYYAAREAFREATGREIDSQYFSQTILRQYLNRNDVDWKITADARGTFSVPNGSFEKRIPVGTIQINKYLENDRHEIDDDINKSIPIEWPSMAVVPLCPLRKACGTGKGSARDRRLPDRLAGFGNPVARQEFHARRIARGFSNACIPPRRHIIPCHAVHLA